MSYCVNCGVELDPSAKTCPLCGTPAWHPELDAPPYFPANSAAVQPASRREAAILLTAMLVSVSLCCGLLNLFLPEGKKLNPMIGAAGISAFPMSGRVVNKMGLAEDSQNFLLMYSISVNVSGQIASVLAGGLILSLMA